MSYFDEFGNLSTNSKVPGIPGYPMNRVFAPVAVAGQVGLELEVEGDPLPTSVPGTITCPKTKARWAVKQDGSLRGGMEYVMSKPCDLEGVEPMVAELFNYFNDFGSKLRPSNRCSTHVHLNVSDWTIDKITSFLVVWSIVEPAIIDWCGLDRKSNHFCLGITDTTTSIEAWNNFLSNGATAFPEGAKYSACNIRHLNDFGSIEIRCGRAPEDVTEITTFTKFLWGVRQFADRHNNPADIPGILSDGDVFGIFFEICRDMGIEDFFEEVRAACPDYEKLGRKSYYETRRLCHIYPWNEWMGEISKPYIVNPFSSSAGKAVPFRARPAEPGFRPDTPEEALDALTATRPDAVRLRMR